MPSQSESVISINASESAVHAIRNELRSFGLNPRDWYAVHPCRSHHSTIILAHREDSGLRLAVNVHTKERQYGCHVINEVKMIVV